MRLPGTRTARRFARSITYRLLRQPIILLYHRVAEPPWDPWSLAVGPSHFAEHLDLLARCYRPISLARLIEGLKSRTAPKNAVVVTFDDGYNDNLYNAKPLLEKFDCPATFFVTSGAVGSDREFWWDELGYLVSAEKKLSEKSGFEIASTDRDRHVAYQSHYTALRLLTSSQIEERLAEIRDRLGIAPSRRPSHRTLTAEEVRRLGDGGLIDIGSHTVTHPVLSAHPAAKQRDEVLNSKRRLEELLGRSVDHFSYPHGSARDFDKLAVSLVRDAGYEAACAAHRGVVRRNADLYRLPRFGVRDWDGEEFARKLWWLFSR